METEKAVKTHFCGGFMPGWALGGECPESQKDKILVLRYNTKDRRGDHIVEIKGPGGGSKTNPEETNPHETFFREFLEETLLYSLTFVEVFTVIVGNHTQHFYLVLKAEGDLRKDEVLQEKSGEILGPPYFEDVETLLYSSDPEKRIWWSHKQALLAAIRYIDEMGEVDERELKHIYYQEA